MSRAWTLQEGALARECVLQLHDCAVELRDLGAQAYIQLALWPSETRWPVKFNTVGDLYLSQSRIGWSPWLYPSLSIYTFPRRCFCCPVAISQRNPLARIIDGIHAGAIGIVAIFTNLLIWPILIESWHSGTHFGTLPTFKDPIQSVSILMMASYKRLFFDELSASIYDSLSLLDPT